MTREEAAGIIKECKDKEFKRTFYTLTEYYTALDMAIKALEQEPMLDKIKAEIGALPKTYPFVNHIDMYVKEDDVKKIIDKYIAEK